MLLSTAYLPPVAYMAAALHAGSVCVEQHETYRKQSCRNHCVIYGPNGKQLLSIPVIKPSGNHTCTRDIRLSGAHSWQRNHWRSIQSAYRNAPFFPFFCDAFEPFYAKRYDFLIDLNDDLLRAVVTVTGLPVGLSRSDSFTPVAGNDPRITLSSKHYLPGTPFPEYFQVFSPRHGFIPNLSILDVIFHLGTETVSYLRSWMKEAENATG